MTPITQELAKTIYPTFRHWADIDPGQYQALSIDQWCRNQFGLAYTLSNPEGVWAIIPSPKSRGSVGNQRVRVNFVRERDYLIFCLKWA
jgi:hypothetical protein